MALSSAAQRIEERNTVRRCKFGVLLSELPDDDLKFYEQMVAQGAQFTHITAVFNEDGHHLNEVLVRRHVKGQCRCL